MKRLSATYDETTIQHQRLTCTINSNSPRDLHCTGATVHRLQGGKAAKV